MLWKNGNTLIETIVWIASFSIIMLSLSSVVFMVFKIDKTNKNEDFVVINRMLLKDISNMKSAELKSEGLFIEVYNDNNTTTIVKYENKADGFYRNNDKISNSQKEIIRAEYGIIVKYKDYEKFYYIKELMGTDNSINKISTINLNNIENKILKLM